jgi:hypothetical protein
VTSTARPRRGRRPAGSDTPAALLVSAMDLPTDPRERIADLTRAGVNGMGERLVRR